MLGIPTQNRNKNALFKNTKYSEIKKEFLKRESTYRKR